MRTTLVVALAVMVVACGGGLRVDGPGKPDGQEGPAKRPATVKACKAGEAVAVGEARVTFIRATAMTLGGEQYGRTVNDPVLRIDYTLENPSPGKILEWNGWQGASDAVDEHGNKFRPFNPPSSFLFTTAEEADAYDTKARIDPATRRLRSFCYEKVPPTTKEIAIELPASVAVPGSADRVAVRLPVERHR